MATVRKRPRSKKSKGGTGYQVRWVDPSGQRKSRTFSTRAEADAFTVKIERDKQTGGYSDPNLGRKVVIGEFFKQRWLPFAEQHYSPSTLKLMTDHWRLYVGPEFEKRKLGLVSKFDIQSFLEKTATNATRYQAEASLRLLRSIFNAAVDDGILARSVALDSKPLKRKSGKVRYLTSEEVTKLVAAHPEQWRAFVLVAAYGGLRFGELAGLRINRVDFPRRKVLVEESIVEVGPKLHLRPPKSGKSRTVSLPEFVMNALAEHIDRWPPNTEGLIFPDDNGGPLWRTNFYKRVWWAAVKRAKIGELRFHDLRHTSAALAIALGAHPKAIQMRLGHHSAAFTLDVYGGLFKGLDEDLADRFDQNASAEAKGIDSRSNASDGNVIDLQERARKRGVGRHGNDATS